MKMGIVTQSSVVCLVDWRRPDLPVNIVYIHFKCLFLFRGVRPMTMRMRFVFLRQEVMNTLSDTPSPSLQVYWCVMCMSRPALEEAQHGLLSLREQIHGILFISSRGRAAVEGRPYSYTQAISVRTPRGEAGDTIELVAHFAIHS